MGGAGIGCRTADAASGDACTCSRTVSSSGNRRVGIFGNTSGNTFGTVSGAPALGYRSADGLASAHSIGLVISVFSFDAVHRALPFGP